MGLKQADIEIGAVYIINHHGQPNVSVQVLQAVTSTGYGYRSGSQKRTYYLCKKIDTGNTITVKSAAKFQHKVVAHV